MVPTVSLRNVTDEKKNGPLTTRLIFRNLSKTVSSVELKNHVLQHCRNGSRPVSITDVCLPKTKTGEFRRIGFIGVKSEFEARLVIDKLHNTFFGTNRLSVSPAYARGSSEIPRPWSRHCVGSSAFELQAARKERRRELRREQRKAEGDTKKYVSRASAERGGTSPNKTSPNGRRSADEVGIDVHKETANKRQRLDDLCTVKGVPGNHSTQHTVVNQVDDAKNMGTTGGTPARTPTKGSMKSGRPLLKKESFVTVVPTKAGVASIRHHIEFIDDDEDSGQVTAKDKRKNRSASIASDTINSLQESDRDGVNSKLLRPRPPSQKGAKLHEAIDEPCQSKGTRTLTNGIHTSTLNRQEGILTPRRQILKESHPRSSATVVKESTKVKESNKESTTPGSPSPNSNDKTDVEEERLIRRTNRLLILNLPYDITLSEVKEHFKPFGEVVECHVCQDALNPLSSKGRAFVTFAFPDHALKARAALNGVFVQGRVVRIVGAEAIPSRPSIAKVSGKKQSGTSSYKRQLEQRLKESAGDPTKWNLLFVSANSAADVVSSALGMEKRQFLTADNATESSLAARVALAETEVILQTKAWLKREGFNLKAFERQGSSLMNCQESHQRTAIPRSTDTLIVKHLPVDDNPSTLSSELTKLFSRHGTIMKLSVAPSCTVAVVKYIDPKHATAAFKDLSYANYRNVPLLLEWAPEDLFVASGEKESETLPAATSDVFESLVIESKEAAGETKPLAQNLDDSTETLKKLVDSQDAAATHLNTSLFIKNLNFATTPERLDEVFRVAPGFLKATIATRKQKKTQASSKSSNCPLSLGYGFVEFSSSRAALDAMARFQQYKLDGHELELQVSQHSAVIASVRSVTSVAEESTKLDSLTQIQNPASESVPASSELKLAAQRMTNKLTIRNLAFQAVKKDLRRLFGAFGTVVATRIPKKGDGTSRGYGFVEFATRTEALTALEALQHTHLYGRKLVIEPAIQESQLGEGQ